MYESLVLIAILIQSFLVVGQSGKLPSYTNVSFMIKDLLK